MLSRILTRFRRPVAPAKRPSTRLAVTALEDRSVPAVTSTFSVGLLTITSDTAADTIKVYRAGNAGSNYYYTANGVQSATFSGVTGITVNGGDGNDTIDVSNVATPVSYDWRKTQPTASTFFNLNYDPVYAFNGAGTNGDVQTNVGVDGYYGRAGWMSTNQANVSGQYIQYYFGDTINVSKLQIWNYNQSYNSTSYGNRGMQSANIQTSMDGIAWTTQLSGVTLTQAPGTNTYSTPDTLYLPGAPSARYVRIVALSNFGSDSYGNFVGLGEVRVFGDAATANVAGPRLNPVAVSATTTQPGTSPVHAVNGYGLNPINPAYHDTNYQFAWLSTNQANVNGQSLTTDLGAITTLDRVRVWNFNQFYGGLSYSNRGMQSAQIQFSTNGVTYTTVATVTIPQAPAVGTYTGYDIDLSGYGTTRYVRLVALSNYGADSYGNYVGLSDVMFFGSVPAPVASLGVTIDGGIGDDTITGGTGPDTITGGSGNDTFAIVPNSTTTQDVVTDFTDGADKLNLKAFGGINAYTTGGSSLVSQGGSAANDGFGNVIVSLPPAYGTKKVKLNSFILANLDDADFVA